MKMVDVVERQWNENACGVIGDFDFIYLTQPIQMYSEGKINLRVKLNSNLVSNSTSSHNV